MLKKHKLIFSLLAVSSVIVVSLPLHAVENYPYFDPKKDGFNIKDDESPWFDGKNYPFFQDMFDGKSIKPQEEGTYQKFPEDSVPVRMVCSSRHFKKWENRRCRDSFFYHDGVCQPVFSMTCSTVSIVEDFSTIN